MSMPDHSILSKSTSTTSSKAIIAVGVAGAIILVGYGIYTFVQNVTGESAFNTASQPYIARYQKCAQQYLVDVQSFLQEDQQLGTGFTQAQQDTLNSLTQCMNTASQGLYKLAQKYGITNLVDAVANSIYYATIALVSAGVLRVLYPFIKSIFSKIRPSDGTSASNAMYQAVIQYMADTGQISPTYASAMQDYIKIVTQSTINALPSFYNSLVLQNILTQTLTTEVIDALSTNIELVTTETLSLLPPPEV